MCVCIRVVEQLLERMATLRDMTVSSTLATFLWLTVRMTDISRDVSKLAWSISQIDVLCKRQPSPFCHTPFCRRRRRHLTVLSLVPICRYVVYSLVSSTFILLWIQVYVYLYTKICCVCVKKTWRRYHALDWSLVIALFLTCWRSNSSNVRRSATCGSLTS